MRWVGHVKCVDEMRKCWKPEVKYYSEGLVGIDGEIMFEWEVFLVLN
jgi:hypothetical protein